MTINTKTLAFLKNILLSIIPLYYVDLGGLYYVMLLCILGGFIFLYNEG